MSADLKARLTWLMLTRATLATILGAGLVLLQLWVQAPELWGSWLSAIGPILLASYLVNLVSWPLIKRPRAPLTLIAYSHLVIDVVISVLVIGHTGRLGSPVSFLLPICVLLGATLFERTGAWVSATLSVGGVIVMSLLEGAEIDFYRLKDTSETLRQLIFSGLSQIGVIALVATLASHLSERLRDAHLRFQVADQDLRTLRRLNERLLTRSQSGVIHLNALGRVLYMNPSAGHLLGLDPLETLNQPLFELAPWLSPDDERIDEEMSHGGYWERTRDGQLTLACVLSSTNEEGERDEGGVALILQDITASKRRQREEERRAHLASIGELTAQVAHELRNPLASIRSSLQLLERMSEERVARTERDDNQQRTQRRLLSILDRETARLAQLTQSFLDVARPPEPTPYLTPLTPILKELCTLTSHAPYVTRLDATEGELSGLTAWVDPDHVRQILLNLIKNAHESYETGGLTEGEHLVEREARISIMRSVARVELTISDRGVGLPQEIDELFVPFKTSKDRGSGLGLALSRSLAESNDGALSAQPRAGGGASFTLSLNTRPQERGAPRSDTLIQVVKDD